MTSGASRSKWMGGGGGGEVTGVSGRVEGEWKNVVIGTSGRIMALDATGVVLSSTVTGSTISRTTGRVVCGDTDNNCCQTSHVELTKYNPVLLNL